MERGCVRNIDIPTGEDQVMQELKINRMTFESGEQEMFIGIWQGDYLHDLDGMKLSSMKLLRDWLDAAITEMEDK